MIHALFTAVPVTVMALPLWVLSRLSELGFELSEKLLEWLEGVTGWRYRHG